jgi:deoxyadenosine/deoxycytidine kinase
MASSNKSIVISIDGNIGSSKSTLLEFLRTNFPDEYVYVDEPLNKWDQIKDAKGQTILQKFYEDQHKYAFSFQTMALLSRLIAIRDAITANPGKVIVSERSLYTDKLVFAKMLFESGIIEDVNYQIYLSWFDAFISQCEVDAIVYIKTDPKVCRERITKRLREGEECIPLEYLENCAKYHDAMVSELAKPTLTLNGNIDLKDKPDLLSGWAQQISEFITNKREEDAFLQNLNIYLNQPRAKGDVSLTPVGSSSLGFLNE